MSGGDFLQAVIHDPAFRWPAPLTRLIARLDELEDAKAEGAQPEAAATLLAAIRELLSLRPDGSEFQRRCADRIDRDPDVAIAHGMVPAELCSSDGSGRGVAAEKHFAGFDAARELEL